jgi:hypothetical protein
LPKFGGVSVGGMLSSLDWENNMLMSSYLVRMGLDKEEASIAEESTEGWHLSWIRQQTVHRSSGRSGPESKAFATITMLSGIHDFHDDDISFIRLKGIVATAAYNWKFYLFAEDTTMFFKEELMEEVKKSGKNFLVEGDCSRKLEAQYAHSLELSENKGFFESLLS